MKYIISITARPLSESRVAQNRILMLCGVFYWFNRFGKKTPKKAAALEVTISQS